MTSRISDIVDRQVRRWEQQARTAASRPTIEPCQRPVITISTLHGAGGREIGHLVATRLGFEVYDRELIEQIANSAHVRRRVVESLDERTQNWIEKYIIQQFEQQCFSAGDYLRHLSRVLLTLGQHGSAVIIGRGAHFILQPSCTLRVRTVAPLEQRVRFTAETEGLTEHGARELVARRDAERLRFARSLFNRDLTDPHHYDLVLNTSAMSLAQSAEAVRSAFQIRFG